MKEAINHHRATTSSPAMLRILQVLKTQGPMNRYTIAEKVHVAKRTIQSSHYMEMLHDEGLVHVCDYERLHRHGPPTIIWAFGPGKDAPRPKLVTDSQAKYKAKTRIARLGLEAVDPLMAIFNRGA